MKSVLFIFILFLWSLPVIHADTIPTIAEANELYKNGEFEKAIKSYEKILSSGVTAAELYYNLGNAYYRTHRIPYAILNYERAKKIKPNDEEINFNLELAQTRIIDKINILPELFFKSWIRKIVHIFSPDEWAYASMLSFLLVLFMTGFFLFTSRRWMKLLTFWMGLLLLCITLGSFTISQQQKHKLTIHNDGIIITPAVTVRSSPDDTGTELFILHEGSKVFIGDTVGEWLEIRISDGNKGWIRAGDLIRI